MDRPLQSAANFREALEAPASCGYALSMTLHRTLAGLLAAIVILTLGAAHVAAFETKAPTAILLDVGTGRVLYEKNADEPPPRSST